MNLKQKIAGLAAACLLFTGGTAWAAEDATPMAQLEEVLKEDGADSGTYHLLLAASAPLGEATASLDVTLKETPLIVSQGVAQVALTPTQLLSPLSKEVPFYWQETEKELIFYSQYNDQWRKIITKKDLKKEAKTKNPEEKKAADKALAAIYAENFMALVKDVQLANLEGNQRVYNVTIDGEKFAAAVQSNIAAQNKGKDKKLTLKPHEAKLIDTALKAWGDFSFNLTEELDSKQITAIHADLTEPLRRAARALIEASDMSTVDKFKYAAMAETINLKFEATGEAFNQIDKVEIPAEVQKAKKVKDFDGLFSEDKK
ncbi:MAG: hypothetical protein IJ849_06880 [Selenomonadaceae bacterium]|nr:hypothetical protein [Selenomonadaceae bacterium]